MEKIEVLLLEDDEQEIKNFIASSERLKSVFNIEFNFTLHRSFYNEEKEIYKNLLLNNYDFFLVDLCLEGDTDGEEKGGNNFLEQIYKRFHIPIIINSAHLGDLSKTFDSPDIPLIKKFDSNEPNQGTDDILKIILSIYKTGITKVIGKTGKINNTLNDLIWSGGLNNFDKWLEFNDEEKANKSLSRYILSHLHHNLSGDYEDFHPEEIYLKVIGDKKFDTGAILKDNSSGDSFIILTPACDIANCNTDYYLVARINDINIDIGGLKNNFEIINNSSSPQNAIDKANKSIEKFIKEMKSDNSKKNKLLPKSTLFKGGYINFEKLEKINKSEESNYEILCYISSHFLKDIISDFGYYYSRQGQPNLNNDIIIKNLLNNSDND